MRVMPFSEKQMRVLCWWGRKSPYRSRSAIICDGAVRSGKTVCMGLSFFLWAMSRFTETGFAVCGKTIRSVRRNVIAELLPELKRLGFTVQARFSENRLTLQYKGRENRFYLFGGKDESSAALIQGVTLGGILFDEVALMPRSFVEQGIARCSLPGARLWFNCNPEHPQHWFYREWIQKAESRNALYLHFTMEDNPSLSPAVRERYRKMFTGAFYSRFIEGKWTAAAGLIYPFMDGLFCDTLPEQFSRYAVSIDYGTVNPTSMGLWGEHGGVWYRIDEYYHDARLTGVRRTDAEHFRGFQKLLHGRKPERIVCDPSAASFIQLLRNAGYNVMPAVNEVLNGIRETATALKTGKIRISAGCTDAVREFSLYRWTDDSARDAPVKENDHAMDDIRYFVSTVLHQDAQFACAVERRGTGGKGGGFWAF
ncbi:MAG: PBSX family phage terminase large subunit [Clostridia bacterium]|nr:PBSX family phage terminase large subunit [Clostridia bacterium]